MLCMCSKRALSRSSQEVGAPGTTAPLPWSPQVGLPWRWPSPSSSPPGTGVCDSRATWRSLPCFSRQRDIMRGLHILALLAPVTMKSGRGGVKGRSLSLDAGMSYTQLPQHTVNPVWLGPGWGTRDAGCESVRRKQMNPGETFIYCLSIFKMFLICRLFTDQAPTTPGQALQSVM